MTGFLFFLATSVAAAILLVTLVMAHHALHPPRRTAAYALRRGLPIDPGALGLQFEEWTHQSSRRAPISVWDVAPAAPAKDSAGFAASGQHQLVSALCIHGWGQSRIDLLALMREFLPCFDRVLMYDRPGHGESPGHALLGDPRELHDLSSIALQLEGAAVVVIASGSAAGLAGALAERPPETSLRGIILVNSIPNDLAALRSDLRERRWPLQPFLSFVLIVLRIVGIRPPRCAESASPGGVPVLRLSLKANEKIPDGEMSRIRDFILKLR